MRYPYKQSFTLAAANLTGHASNVTGASWAIATASAGDKVAHHITVHNDSATNHSAKTIVLVGKDPNGIDLTETIAAPGASATVTSTKAFKELLSATPSATIGADTFDIGWTATGHTPWVDLNASLAAFSASVLVIAGGTINYDVQHTYDDAPSESSQAINHSAMTAKTATADGQYIAPVTAVRVNINSHTSGTVEFNVLQGDR